MDNDLKLSPAMTHALEVTGLDDIMQGGPTRAALMRRGLVFKREGSGQFGYFTQAGRELATELQAIKAGEHWSDKAAEAESELEQEDAPECPAGDACTGAAFPGHPAHDPTPEPAQRPDPTKTGPCELKLSFACTGAGYERLDPRDMLAPETSFRDPRISCVSCYEMAADHYIREVHS